MIMERLIYTLLQGNLLSSLAVYAFSLMLITLGVVWKEPLAILIPCIIILFYWVMNFFMFRAYKQEGWGKQEEDK